MQFPASKTFFKTLKENWLLFGTHQEVKLRINVTLGECQTGTPAFLTQKPILSLDVSPRSSKAFSFFTLLAFIPKISCSILLPLLPSYSPILFPKTIKMQIAPICSLLSYQFTHSLYNIIFLKSSTHLTSSVEVSQRVTASLLKRVTPLLSAETLCPGSFFLPLAISNTSNCYIKSYFFKNIIATSTRS